jgi:hypothetical protein
MRFQTRIQHWIVDWLWLGMVCIIVALVNIFARPFSDRTASLVLFFTGLSWVIGGIICYGFEGIKPPLPSGKAHSETPAGDAPVQEWHSASDFVIPGTRKTFILTHHTRIHHH